ncbi:putative baseplate assembly protein [Candidatus Uabimicrobium sp. HlEnr_7]|uniref:putative baseplate assembly protein n=1 Tax=Candidatus Uabimicrobium helgolandensis TaxID=3095367 RepID=UPI003558939A
MHFHLDHRTAEDIFKHTVELAREYCPEWTKDWPENIKDIDTGDFRVVVLKLFSELSETIIQQLNLVPYKYLVAFLDLMGVSPLPAEPATVPLSFKIAEGAKSAYVPFRTQVASSENGNVVFETQQGLSVFRTPLTKIVSLNSWYGMFTEHSLELEQQQKGFYIFGKDDKEKFIPHLLYLGDPLLFASEKPVNMTVRITGAAKNFKDYFSIWKDSTGNIYEPETSLKENEYKVVFKDIGPLEKSVVNGEENYWLSVAPDFSEVKIIEEDYSVLPSIDSISADLQIKNLIPELAIANDSPVEIEKGFFPFGETPKKLDACYLCSSNFAKVGSQITLNIKLQEDLHHINPVDYIVTDKDLKDLFLLKKRLVNNSKISQYLQTRFPSELQVEIEKNEEPEVLKEKILEALNTIINGELLYDAKAFKGISLSEQARYSIYNGNLAGKELQRVNRILLENVFPTEIQHHLELSLIWEYWNGEKWLNFEQEKKDLDLDLDEDQKEAREFEDEFLFVDKTPKNAPDLELKDNTRGLTRSGSITFICPEIKAVEISGIKNFWIRIRIAKGTYGLVGGYVKTRDIFEILDGWDEIANILVKEGIIGGSRYQAPEYTPPFIENMTLDILYREKSFATIKNYSNFEYSTCDQSKSFRPYMPVVEENPSLYLGFNEDIAGIPYALYFALREIYNDKDIRTLAKDLRNKKQVASATVSWKYYDGENWRLLEVEHGDSFFGSGEITKFYVPQNIKKSNKFGQNLLWIKIEVEGNKVNSPYIKGIHFNSVWAKNSVTIANEVLGSSNDEPSLQFQLTHTPILKKQQIVVRESKLVPKEEQELLFTEEGKDAIFTENEETWVRWHEVRDFSGSNSFSRHYTLNRQNGIVVFGDGINGMVPCKGTDNIIAKIYNSGGGKNGNVSINTVTSLTTNIPSIDSVNNYAVASGGNDQERLDDAVRRGPQTIKSKDRVVTKEDYEWLAQMASQEVARAKYIESSRGEVIIAIVPSDESEIRPKKALLDTVAKYLQRRALISITKGIRVIGPQYQKVNVTTEITTVSITEITQIEENALRLLSSFLHPIKGGNDKQGWEFGSRILLVDIVKILNSIDQVVSIKKITLEKLRENRVIESAYGTNQGWITLEANSLPVVGNIKITVTTE